MIISNNFNNVSSVYSQSFGSKEVKKSEQKNSTNEISKSTSDAIKAAVLPAIAKSPVSLGFPLMPTFESVTAELNEPLVVGGKVVFAPKNENKFDLDVLEELANSSTKDNIELEKSNKYSNFKIRKSNTGYVLGFDYPSKNSNDKNAKYFMCVKNDGRVSFVSKETSLKLSSKKEVKKEESARSINEQKPLPNPVLASVNYQLAGPRFEWAVDVGVDYVLSPTGKVVPHKYLNEMADIAPFGGKKHYDGDITDKDVINFLKDIDNK